MISATLNEWANSLGKDPDTLKRAMVKHGVAVPEDGEDIPAPDIIRTIFGDKHTEEVRNLKADADRKEREEKEALGEVVQMEAVETLLTEWLFVPLTQALADMPSTIDSRCNPENPILAQTAIREYLEDNLKPHMQGKLPKPQPKKKKK